jgi:DNA ligase 1
MNYFILAEDWNQGTDPSGWMMSEKLDGVRAQWDGECLVSRGGRTISAPEWWTQQLPATTIDGELWAGRGRFEFVNAAQNRRVPDDSEWREIVFMAFDAPEVSGSFSARYTSLSAIPASKAFRVVEHRRCQSTTDFIKFYQNIIAAGGEGAILRRPGATYRAGRSPDFLRLKPIDDATAKVLGHTAGEGKYIGRLGALICQAPSGIVFKIGTGLTDYVRECPPAIGQTISYQFRGTTKYGVPRHAAFIG